MIIKPTDLECLEMCREHLAYEIQMLNHCALQIDGTESLMQNLYIEGFALHLRNVIGFLYSDPQQDDLCANHLFASGTWQTIRGDKSDIIKDAEYRAHKQMTHITLFRLRKQRFEISEIINALVPVLMAFLNSARQDLIHPELRRQVESLRRTTAHVSVFSGTTSTTTSYSGDLPITRKLE